MKGVRYYCEVLRRCFGEYLGQSDIAIAVHRGNNRDMKRQYFFLHQPVLISI